MIKILHYLHNIENIGMIIISYIVSCPFCDPDKQNKKQIQGLLFLKNYLSFLIV